MRFWMCLMVLASIALAACRPGQPIIDPGPKPTRVDGTIAGVVRTADGGTPLVGRRVTATETASGTKYETSTGNTGGYSIKVPPGRYRVVVELKAGETASKSPGEIDVNASDVDAARDFEVSMSK